MRYIYGIITGIVIGSALTHYGWANVLIKFYQNIAEVVTWIQTSI
jgi:hypothetical protein